jgi:hypothetical protein
MTEASRDPASINRLARDATSVVVAQQSAAPRPPRIASTSAPYAGLFPCRRRRSGRVGQRALLARLQPRDDGLALANDYADLPGA